MSTRSRCLFLAALASATLVGCGADDAAPPQPADIDVSIVTAPPIVDELDDGDPLALIIGPQFGVMLQLGLRSSGLDPTRPRLSWAVHLDGELRTDVTFASPFRPSETEDGAYELPPIPLLLDGVSPEGLEAFDGKDLVVSVGVEDTAGHVLDVSVSCVATH